MSDLLSWETRFRWILSVWHWGALMLGVFVAAIRLDPGPGQVVAGALVGAYVVTVEALPHSLKSRAVSGEVLVVAGVSASLAAMALTGGTESPYAIFSLAPTFLAATFIGTRAGLTAALLSAAGVAAVAAVLDENLPGSQVLVFGALYLVIAVGQSQARRLLIEGQRQAVFRRTSAEAQAGAQRVEAAHALLTDLAPLADAAHLNPITVGREALRMLDEITAFEAGWVALAGHNGPAVVARRREEEVRHHRAVFALEVDGREVGFVVLARPSDFDDQERRLVSTALRPVALAFDNILILRDIARKAVHQERIRLARELHDEIGPSLASLGLALDLAILQYPTEPDLTAHLEDLRSEVGALVEEVRSAVSDLRRDEPLGLVQRAAALAADVDPDGPQVFVKLDERRPPRPALADDLDAIVTEAFRNAVRHSGAEEVRIEGFVDYGTGKVIVADDGRGFDTTTDHAGHFGLLGMSERAARIGATLTVESVPGAGTEVSVEWG